MCDVQVLRAIAIPRPIPVLLSVVAGYVDSCTYLGLFGVFVAQATGSFVLAGTRFIKSEPGLLGNDSPFVFLLRRHGCNGACPFNEAAHAPVWLGA